MIRWRMRKSLFCSKQTIIRNRWRSSTISGATFGHQVEPAEAQLLHFVLASVSRLDSI